MKNRLSPQDLEAITSRTVGHYSSRARDFWEGTRDHDVSENIQALLSALPTTSPLRILDLGCGPGRDLKTFKSLGHEPTGLDACSEFCEMARAHSGCPVLHQSFLTLRLEPESFDGIFANASLFHVPRQELRRVLGDLHAALAPQGALFSSNPRGQSEGWSGQRYGAYYEWEEYAALLKQAGFAPLHHYYRPRGLPCAEQPWLASVSRKT